MTYIFMEKTVEKYKAKLKEQVHELMKKIDNLNDEEYRFYSNKEIKPEEITLEKLEESSKNVINKAKVLTKSIFKDKIKT